MNALLGIGAVTVGVALFLGLIYKVTNVLYDLGYRYGKKHGYSAERIIFRRAFAICSLPILTISYVIVKDINGQVLTVGEWAAFAGIALVFHISLFSPLVQIIPTAVSSGARSRNRVWL